jgi:hypothetical protein
MSTAATTMSGGELDAGNTRVLFIERVESRKTDVGDFFLRE